ncbi:conserved exported hypothetical protein [Rubrivivax sp. A210]|uniref:multiheme c-type cytochrome n=1 Tax=Rubrivivax sp. A210 TaxID=2772301 RepID=UPI00191885D9|nr:multiheme c-type cytochrome [Rubrivivax sp. A210]CAD5372801.1 conserved exported hypothetical protein [Rubrivivax sp. A210]
MNGFASVLTRTAATALMAVALLQAGAALAAAEATLPEGDRACLDCHGSDAKPQPDGRKAATVDTSAYLHSVHGDAGCDSCHETITLPGHPGKAVADAPARRKASVSAVCRSCHAKIVKAYDRSFHAERLRAKVKSAPDCDGCHSPHAITTASVQDGTKNACLACHDDPAATHKVWLPNAARHMQTVACAACHAPEAQPRVDLRLVDTDAPAGSALAGRFEILAKLADTRNDGLDAHEFRALLQALEREGAKVTVQGRIELKSGVQAHALPDKTRALRDCYACHDQDAAPYKSVAVSMLDAGGGPVRVEAQREILSSAVTIEALRGFYALGGTRLAQLDLLLALGLGLGVSVPGLHFITRRLMRRSQPQPQPQQPKE